MENKRGISGIVAAVIMIALVMSVTVIVWTVVNNLVTKQAEGSSSCFGIFGKVKINNEYTCYDGVLDELRFSIGVEDIDVSEVLVAISGGGTGVSFKITNELSFVDNDLSSYPGGLPTVRLPAKNAGTTYVFDMSVLGEPESIELAPIIGSKQCDVSDSLYEFDSCASLA